MKHASLFSGIGGFDLAAEWMGWENVFHCEKDKFCQKVLKYHFKNSILHDDIKTTDFRIYRGKIDILTGGFPCQPFSLAGKRKGTEDDRYLWEEMLRAIREIQPPWIVGENVYGLINWNNGMVFEQIISDLEAEGYEVAPVILPACSVDAPHKRYRIWFIAYSDNKRTSTGYKKVSGKNEKISERNKNTKFSYSGITTNTTGIRRRERWTNSNWFKSKKKIRSNIFFKLKRFGKIGIASNTNYTSTKHEIQTRWKLSSSKIIANSNSGRQSGEKYWKKESGQFAKESFSNYWENFPTQSYVCSGDDGISDRLDGITFPKWRNESIKAYGNAVVPQLVLQIFKAIEKFNKTI